MKIAPLRMNADYESMLYYGRGAPQILNHSLETFILFLEHRPLVSTKKYPQAYLDYVESITHHKPEIISKSEFSQNWWGDYQNLDLERKLNSKITSARLIQEKKWCARTFVVEEDNDIRACPHLPTFIHMREHAINTIDLKFRANFSKRVAILR